MKEASNDGFPKIAWVLNPITFVVAMWFLIMFCISNCESCYQPCRNVPNTTYKSTIIGNIVSSDGETCKLEEITVTIYSANYGKEIFNKEESCHYFEYEKPFLRRMICPSGKNGQSTVEFERVGKKTVEALK